MGLFEKQGFHVIAYPVGYRTLGQGHDLRLDFGPARNLRIFELAESRMDRPRGLLGERADRPSVSRTGRRRRAGVAGLTDAAAAYSEDGAPRR